MRQPIEESPPGAVVSRPALDQSVPDRVRDWIEWFGVARLVTSALAVIVVCVGGWWLVRAPSAPPESALPVAGPNVAAGSITLAPPSTVVDDLGVASTPSVIVVHVAGAVHLPGVFELPGGSRLGDAIDRAGGPLSDADPGVLNLAAPLVDGTRIYVPMIGEETPIEVAGPVGATPDASEPVGPVDINRAGPAELEALPGVGPTTAAAIIAERDRNGPFASLADLERVPGIGPAKLAGLEGLVTT